MNITKEIKDELNFTLKLNITAEDYEPKVKKALNNYRKKAQIKGFRPGNAPVALIKKMAGPSILMQEIDSLVSESLSKYLVDEKLNILGQPLPSDKQQQIDPENQTEFDFFFDIAIAPEFELSIDKRTKIPYYTINVEQKIIDQEVERYQNQFGKAGINDSVSEKSYLKVNINQLDIEGKHAENGISVENSMIAVDIIKNEQEKAKLLGKKNGETIEIDLVKAFPNETELSSMLNIEKERISEIVTPFALTINEITTFAPAELNQELFDKAFGKDNVKTEEEFKNKIKESIDDIYARESEFRFAIDSKEKIVSKLKLPLPQGFLKRWIMATNSDKNLSLEQLETEYPMFEKDLQWQLVKNKIAEEQKFEISTEEVRQESKKFTEAQFAQYGLPLGSLSDEQMAAFVDKNLEREEDRTRFAERVIENKVVNYLKENVKLEETIIDLEDFKKLYEKE